MDFRENNVRSSEQLLPLPACPPARPLACYPVCPVPAYAYQSTHLPAPVPLSLSLPPVARPGYLTSHRRNFWHLCRTFWPSLPPPLVRFLPPVCTSSEGRHPFIWSLPPPPCAALCSLSARKLEERSGRRTDAMWLIKNGRFIRLVCLDGGY